MTALFLRFLWVSLTTSAVLLPLLLCQKAISRRYRAKSCYLLWLLLCLRLLLPVQLPLSQPVVTVVLPAQTAAAPLEETASKHPRSPVSASSPESSLSLTEVGAAVWLAGAAAVLGWHGWACRSLRRQLKAGARQAAGDQAALHALGGRVPVLRCAVESPMTLGLLRPVILLPEDTAEEDLPMILRHELCHLRRGDLWYKALFLLCAALHWFNPLVWRLGRAAGDTLELCCDEAVVAGQDLPFRRRYGQVLLRSAASSGPALSTSLGSGDLKGRIMNLFITKKRGTALLCAAVCAAALTGSLVGCDTASAAQPVPAAETPEAIPAVPGKDLVLDVDSAELESESSDWLWPVEGEYRLTALYGGRVHPITGQTTEHSGMDIAAEADTPVLSAQPGTVLEADFDAELGNYVLVAHGDDTQALYGCLKESAVSAGETVALGQTIGTVGQTGQATCPHLHFEVRGADGVSLDPLDQYPESELVPD